VQNDDYFKNRYEYSEPHFRLVARYKGKIYWFATWYIRQNLTIKDSLHHDYLIRVPEEIMIEDL